MSPLRAFPTLHLALCLTLALSMALAPSLGIAQEAATAAMPAGDALSYVTPGACVVAVIRPKQLLSAPAAEMFPTEILQAAATTALGIDPLQIEEAVVSWSPPANYAVYIRSSEALALKEGEITRHTSPGTLNGKPYLKSDNHFEPSFYAPDAESLLVAPDFIVNQLVAEKPSPRPAVLKNFDGAVAADDFHAAVNMAMLRPVIAMAM